MNLPSTFFNQHYFIPKSPLNKSNEKTFIQILLYKYIKINGLR
jgi:hypothetical protein